MRDKLPVQILLLLGLKRGFSVELPCVIMDMGAGNLNKESGKVQLKRVSQNS